MMHSTRFIYYYKAYGKDHLDNKRGNLLSF